MPKNSDFDNYIQGLKQLDSEDNRTELEGVYTLNSSVFQYFKSIGKSVQDVLGKTAVSPIVVKQLETALPTLTKLRTEINKLGADANYAVGYKTKIDQTISYIKNEMALDEVNDMSKQYFDLLNENKEFFNMSEKNLERFIIINADAEAESVYVAGGDVYVVGYRCFSNAKKVATLWKNGEVQNIIDRKSSVFRSIFVSGNDVYIAGTDSKMGYTVATLWKNDVLQHLTDGSTHAGACSVYVSNDDVYVAGHEGNIAKLWINGIPQNLANGKVASSVFVASNDVYVAGNGEGGAILWKNGIAQYLDDGNSNSICVSRSDDLTGTKWTFYGLSSSSANSVYVYDNDVYVVGTQWNDDGRFATLWKNGIAQNLTDGTCLASANSVYVHNNDVYVAGEEYIEPNSLVSVAQLWKNGIPQNLTNGICNASANSVCGEGKNVYVVGCEEFKDDILCLLSVAKFWKNGVVQNLSNEPMYVKLDRYFIS